MISFCVEETITGAERDSDICFSSENTDGPRRTNIQQAITTTQHLFVLSGENTTLTFGPD